MAVSITVCNLALGELRAPSITDIDEASTEAQSCARYYPLCLKLLLERHEWSFATKIAMLAALTLNPRESEWGYAYALPSDIATAKRLVWPLNPVPTPRYYWPFDGDAPRDWQQGFIVEAGILYAQIPGAILEYSASDISEAVMPGMFIDALSFSLAARLAVPMRDSQDMKRALLQQAEIAAQRAIADDRNRQPQRDDAYTDEVTMARGVG